MDRKDFLLTVWKKGIKPILLFVIIFFCGKFLFNIFAESGTERLVTILIIGLGFLMLIVYLIGELFKSITVKINSILPESIKFWIRVIRKFLNYLSPIIFGAIIYHFWKEDWIIAAIISGIILVQRIAEIIKEEKLVTTSDIPNANNTTN